MFIERGKNPEANQIKIQFYMHVDLDGFRSIIDSMCA